MDSKSHIDIIPTGFALFVKALSRKMDKGCRINLNELTVTQGMINIIETSRAKTIRTLRIKHSKICHSQGTSLNTSHSN